jgi:hypothetical protein
MVVAPLNVPLTDKLATDNVPVAVPPIESNFELTAVSIFVISTPIDVALTILDGLPVGSESKELHAKLGVKELISLSSR